MPDPFIILPAPGAWRVGPAAGPLTAVPAAADAAPEDLARAVAEALRSAGHAGQGTAFAIPSAWCLCAAVPTDGLPPRNWRRAMAYRLEERLPVSAEDVVADFVPASGGDEALGVCVEKRAVAPLVAALEAEGVSLDAVCPAALLAVQQLAGQGATDGADAVLWAADDRLELFLLRGGRPRAWYLLPDDPKDLRLHLELEGVGRTKPARVLVLGAATAARAVLTSWPGVTVVTAPGGATGPGDGAVGGTGFQPVTSTSISDSPADREHGLETRATPEGEPATGLLAPHDDPALPHTLAMAVAVLAGGAAPWVNLRRDDLAVGDPLRAVRAPLTVAAAAVVLCLVTACAAMLWRAHRYDQLADRYAGEQQAVFRTAFPGRPVPADVRSRLDSEVRALRGLAGGDPSARPPDAPGLVALRDLLAGLPTDVRFRVLEARLDGAKFTLEGQANTHGDADAIATALRQGGPDGNGRRFVVDPPRTEQLPAAGDGGGPQAVSFSITGSFAPTAGTAPGRSGGRATP